MIISTKSNFKYKVRYIATKGDEREEFETWKEFAEWGTDVADRTLYSLYHDSEADGRSGMEFNEWKYEYNTYGQSWVEEALDIDGWKVEALK